MKILIATDGSAFSQAAVEEFAGTPLPPGSEVLVVSAFEKASHAMVFELMGAVREYQVQIEKNLSKAAEEAAEQAVKILKEKNPNLPVKILVTGGSPKTVILDEAEAFKADLIVVGSHGHSGLERFLLGSVAQAVALHAKCSVEIARKRKV